MIDSGTVYHFWLPTLIDGVTTSPNMSRGTGCSPYAAARARDGVPPRKCFKSTGVKDADYSQSKN
jgi:hypothetical protein